MIEGPLDPPRRSSAQGVEAMVGDSVTLVVPPIAYYKRWTLLLGTAFLVGLLGAALYWVPMRDPGSAIAHVTIALVTSVLLAGTVWGFLQRTIIQASRRELVIRHALALGRTCRRFAADRVQNVRWASRENQTEYGDAHYWVWATLDGEDRALIKTEALVLASYVARTVRRCMNHAPPGGDGSVKKVRFERQVLQVLSRTPDAIADELMAAGFPALAAKEFGEMLADEWARPSRSGAT